MAESHKIDVILQAQDRATAPLRRITGGFDLLTKQGLAAGAMFASVTMGMNLAMQGFSKLQQWVGNSIQKFLEFERTMSEVATMLSETGEQLLPQITKAIEEMSVAFGKSAVDLGRAEYQILSAGISASESINVLKESAKLATATLTSVETAVDAVTTVLNAYGMEASQVSQVTEIMNKTIQLGKLRMDDLANALGYVVPIAAQAGISFEEVSAAIATLTKQGINAHKASRGLRQVINNLIAPSDEAKSAMIKMGVAFDDLTLESQGLNWAMQQINSVTGGSVSAISLLIPNVQALSTALGLMANDGQIMGDSIEYINERFSSLDESFQDIAESADFARKRIEALNDAQDRMIGDISEEQGRQLGTGWSKFVLGLTGMGAKFFEGPIGMIQGFQEGWGLFDTIMEQVENNLDDVSDKTEEYAGLFDILYDKWEDARDLLPLLKARQKLYQDQLANITAQKIQIDALYKHRRAIEELNQVSQLYAANTRANNIEIMRIQLAASYRRGRMTREEKHQLEDLQRSNLQLRIKDAEHQQDIYEKTKNDAINTLDSQYEQQVASLKWSIDYTELLLNQYSSNIEVTTQKMQDAWDLYYKWWFKMDDEVQRRLAAKGYSVPGSYTSPEFGKGVNKLLAGLAGHGTTGSAVARQISGLIGRLLRFQHGGTVPGYIGQPQLALVHGGEKITPAHKSTTQNITMPISINATITDRTDLPTLAEKLGRLIRAELADTSGVSRYQPF